MYSHFTPVLGDISIFYPSLSCTNLPAVGRCSPFPSAFDEAVLHFIDSFILLGQGSLIWL